MSSPESPTEFIAWPDIQSFSSVRKQCQKYPSNLLGETSAAYCAKVKIHGTNAAVQVKAGEIAAQSRTQIITPDKDNAGFAAWVESTADLWRERGNALGYHICFFGEWCGPGIQAGVAVNKIPNKVFAIFAATYCSVQGIRPVLITEPAFLAELVGNIPNTHILPWFGSIIGIPVLGTTEELEPTLNDINKHVSEVENCDPWVKDTFGISGTGEGLVYYPMGADWEMFSNLAFKAKGEKHQIVAKTKPAQVDPATMHNIDAFVEAVLTPARLEQGSRAIAGGELVYTVENTAQFLRWISADVEKETLAEREASGLSWDQVRKQVSGRARDWYIEKSKGVI